MGPLRVSPLQLFILALSLALMLAVQGFLRWSKWGRAIRGTAQDPVTSGLLGINSNRVIGLTFAIASVLGGVAGILNAMYFGAIYPAMGFIALIKAFTAAILGGMGSVPGAVLGGFVLGLAESLGAAYLPSGFSDALPFGLLFIVLLLVARRPDPAARARRRRSPCQHPRWWRSLRAPARARRIFRGPVTAGLFRRYRSDAARGLVLRRAIPERLHIACSAGHRRLQRHGARRERHPRADGSAQSVSRGFLCDRRLCLRAADDAAGIRLLHRHGARRCHVDGPRHLRVADDVSRARLLSGAGDACFRGNPARRDRPLDRRHRRA